MADFLPGARTLSVDDRQGPVTLWVGLLESLVNNGYDDDEQQSSSGTGQSSPDAASSEGAVQGPQAIESMLSALSETEDDATSAAAAPAGPVAGWENLPNLAGMGGHHPAVPWLQQIVPGPVAPPVVLPVEADAPRTIEEAWERIMARHGRRNVWVGMSSSPSHIASLSRCEEDCCCWLCQQERRKKQRYYVRLY